jgi:hypothetical protein
MRRLICTWKNVFAKLGVKQKKGSRVRQRNLFARHSNIEALEGRQMLSITVNTSFDVRGK